MRRTPRDPPRPTHPLPRGPEQNTVDLGGAATVATAQARAAALVAVAHATDPDDARELLAMLGLIDALGQPTP